MSLARAITAGLAAAGDRPVLGLLDERGQLTAELSGRQLAGSADAWAARFTAATLGPGDRVLLSPARDAELPALHLGALAAGLTVVPLNPALSDTETGRLAAACRPALAVVTMAAAAARPGLGADVPCWTIADGPTGAQPRPGQSGGKDEPGPALIIFTSGTTGQPKGVRLTDANLLYDLESLMRLWAVGPPDRILHMLPAHHFHGLVLALYGPLMSGAQLLVLPRFDARTALDAARDHRATVIMGVPTMYRRMLEEAGRGDDLSGLRLALCGSAPLPPSLGQAFHERFGVALVERYGLTECGIVTSNAVKDPVAGSVGRALEGTTITIRHHDGYHRAGSPAATRSGEICVAGPSVMAGYLDDAAATASLIHDGYLHSGDLGRFDADGNLFIDGRLKDLIIVGGTNVVPGEVEAALAVVEGVTELAVVGRPDEDLGETVVAWVVAGPGADPAVIVEELGRHAAGELAAYKRPRDYLFCEELPRNAMGKLDRARLADRT